MIVYPHAINLKLDRNNYGGLLAALSAWLVDHQARYYFVSQVLHPRYVEIGMRFEDERLALLCRLTWSGQ